MPFPLDKCKYSKWSLEFKHTLINLIDNILKFNIATKAEVTCTKTPEVQTYFITPTMSKRLSNTLFHTAE